MSASEFTDDDIRRIDALRYPQLFNELVDFASDALLGAPLERRPYSPPDSPEAKIIAQVGTRGLSMALDIMRNPLPTYSFNEYFSLKDERKDDYVWIDSAFRSTSEKFSDPVDFEIIDTARQFGEALLKDAYLSLGPGVERQLERLRSARSTEQQATVIDWLEDRFAAMKSMVESEDEDQPDENGAYYYNPLRLSRRFTGDHPKMRVRPTCLGISIIAASFFEQAGLPYLHAGVMSDTTGDSLTNLSQALVTGTRRVLDQDEFASHVLLISSMVSKLNQVEADLLSDNGYHAANYVRLANGMWCQFDPNLRRTTIIPNVGLNERLDQAYDDITTLKNVAPGIERSLDTALSSVPNQLYSWQDSIEWTPLPEDAIRDIMTNDESILDNLTSLMCEHFATYYARYSPESSQQNIKRLIKEKVLFEGARAIIESYVLWGEEDVRSFQERCLRDTAFLQRRLADMQMAQFFIIPGTILELAQSVSSQDMGMPHRSFELGDPATRIGFSVLGDFATFFDSRLPANFWVSHWASKIPITETLSLEDEGLPEAQRKFQQNALLHLSMLPHGLQYLKAYGIIGEFLPPAEHTRGGDEDGHSGDGQP